MGNKRKWASTEKNFAIIFGSQSSPKILFWVIFLRRYSCTMATQVRILTASDVKKVRCSKNASKMQSAAQHTAPHTTNTPHTHAHALARYTNIHTRTNISATIRHANA